MTRSQFLASALGAAVAPIVGMAASEAPPPPASPGLPDWAQRAANTLRLQLNQTYQVVSIELKYLDLPEFGPAVDVRIMGMSEAGQLCHTHARMSALGAGSIEAAAAWCIGWAGFVVPRLAKGKAPRMDQIVHA